MRWDGTGWETGDGEGERRGMGWDGMGWDEMGWDGIACCAAGVCAPAHGEARAVRSVRRAACGEWRSAERDRGRQRERERERESARARGDVRR